MASICFVFVTLKLTTFTSILFQKPLFCRLATSIMHFRDHQALQFHILLKTDTFEKYFSKGLYLEGEGEVEGEGVSE
jgi:hypothetical protein